MSANKQVIDLTDESRPAAAPSRWITAAPSSSSAQSSFKGVPAVSSLSSGYARRANPPSFVVSGGVKSAFPNSSTAVTSSNNNRQAIPQPHAGYRSLPPSIIKGPPYVKIPSAYEANASMRISQQMARPQQTFTYQPPAPVEPALPIKFGIVNNKYFTARAEYGKVSTPVIELLTQVPGANFDFTNKRWLFPISEHTNLLVGLSRRQCSVEPIPQTVLSAIQLQTTSSSSSSAIAGEGADGDNSGDQITSSFLLAKGIPQTVIDQLAPFQREATKFVYDKDGRALIADEMGLGKTRTAIAAACFYHDSINPANNEWPILIVCPSSARFHWKHETLVMLKGSGIVESEDEVMVIEHSKQPIFTGHSSSKQTTKKKKTGKGAKAKAKANKGKGKGKVTAKRKRQADDDDDNNIDDDSDYDEADDDHSSSSSDDETTNEEEDMSASPLAAITAMNGIKVVIISYALIPKLASSLALSSSSLASFRIIIADESHYIKSPHAKRTKLLIPLLHTAKRVLLLSGTPALSRPVELYTQLHALLPKEWPDFKAFGKRYCIDPPASSNSNSSSSKKAFGKEGFKGANNTQELHVILTASVMIRRLKRDILQQLPIKRRYLIKIGIEDESKRELLKASLHELKMYEEIIKGHNGSKGQGQSQQTLSQAPRRLKASDFCDGEDESEALSNLKQRRRSLLMEVFRDSGLAKLPTILQQLTRLLNNDLTGKVLIFAHHRNVLDAISLFVSQQLGIDYIRIDGLTKSSDRHTRTVLFQTNPNIRVAVLGITAAGIALTLTAANIVFFAELYWTPGSLIQAEDRAHRIGQMKAVKVFYFFAEHSIDELLWPLVRKKMQLLGEIVEGKEDIDLAAVNRDEVHAAKRTVSKATSDSQQQEKQDRKKTAEGGNGAFQESSEAVDREVMDLVDEDNNDLANLAEELAKEEGRSGDLLTKATAATAFEVDDDEDDDEEGQPQPDDYEEYLKKATLPIDRLAMAFLRHLEMLRQTKAAAENPQHQQAAVQMAVMQQQQQLQSQQGMMGSYQQASQQFLQYNQQHYQQLPQLQPSSSSSSYYQQPQPMPYQQQQAGGFVMAAPRFRYSSSSAMLPHPITGQQQSQYQCQQQTQQQLFIRAEPQNQQGQQRQSEQDDDGDEDEDVVYLPMPTKPHDIIDLIDSSDDDDDKKEGKSNSELTGQDHDQGQDQEAGDGDAGLLEEFRWEDYDFEDTDDQDQNNPQQAQAAGSYSNIVAKADEVRVDEIKDDMRPDAKRQRVLPSSITTAAATSSGQLPSVAVSQSSSTSSSNRNNRLFDHRRPPPPASKLFNHHIQSYSLTQPQPQQQLLSDVNNADEEQAKEMEEKQSSAADFACE